MNPAWIVYTIVAAGMMSGIWLTVRHRRRHTDRNRGL